MSAPLPSPGFRRDSLFPLASKEPIAVLPLSSTALAGGLYVTFPSESVLLFFKSTSWLFPFHGAPPLIVSNPQSFLPPSSNSIYDLFRFFSFKAPNNCEQLSFCELSFALFSLAHRPHRVCALFLLFLVGRCTCPSCLPPLHYSRIGTSSDTPPAQSQICAGPSPPLLSLVLCPVCIRYHV